MYAVGPELRLATFVTASGTYQLRVRALDHGVNVFFFFFITLSDTPIYEP